MSIPMTNITVSILFREFIIMFLSAFDLGSWQPELPTFYIYVGATTPIIS